MAKKKEISPIPFNVDSCLLSRTAINKKEVLFQDQVTGLTLTVLADSSIAKTLDERWKDQQQLREKEFRQKLKPKTEKTE